MLKLFMEYADDKYDYSYKQSYIYRLWCVLYNFCHKGWKKFNL